MTLRKIAAVLLALPIAACSGGNVLQTGSLFGGGAKPEAAAQPQSTVTSRALQVGSTAARAQKCGFNFDPVKLRTQYLASESALDPAGLTTAQQIYDTAYRGVSRGVAAKGEDYCTPGKVAVIKSALNRHLAGDFMPDATAAPSEGEGGGGLFGGFGDTSGSSSSALEKMTKPVSEW